MRALITCHHLQRHFETFRKEFESRGVTPVLPEIAGQQLDAAEMRALIADVDGVIAGDDVMDRSVLEQAQAGRLKAVIKWGIGTDAIDKPAAQELGLPVYNTPGAFGGEVADLAMTYALLLCRPLHRMHASVMNGGWAQFEGRSLSALRCGIIGLGSIGQNIAQRARSFGMDIRGTDIHPPSAEICQSLGVELSSFDEVLGHSDMLFVACALTQDNHHLLSHDAFARMPDGAFVINVGRGPLIDESALIAALASGKIAGAGLDVFEVEPLPTTSPLREFPSCIFGTHCGSNTREAVDRINRKTIAMLWHVLEIEKMDENQLNRVA